SSSIKEPIGPPVTLAFVVDGMEHEAVGAERQMLSVVPDLLSWSALIELLSEDALVELTSSGFVKEPVGAARLTPSAWSGLLGGRASVASFSESVRVEGKLGRAMRRTLSELPELPTGLALVASVLRSPTPSAETSRSGFVDAKEGVTFLMSSSTSTR
ncbi:hypothetical protein C8R45DRAFT_1028776, partial [Mycena sanguinolenta]